MSDRLEALAWWDREVTDEERERIIIELFGAKKRIDDLKEHLERKAPALSGCAHSRPCEICNVCYCQSCDSQDGTCPVCGYNHMDKWLLVSNLCSSGVIDIASVRSSLSYYRKYRWLALLLKVKGERKTAP